MRENHELDREKKKKKCLKIVSKEEYIRLNFNKPIPAGTIVELIGKVTYVGNKSLKVSVEIFIEEMYSDVRYQAINGEFTFVALDKDKKPTKVIKK